MARHLCGQLTFISGLALMAAGSSGCSDAAEDHPAGQRVSLAVAPLSLPDIDDVCYGFAITNGDPALLRDPIPTNDPDTVTSETHVCSGQFGDGAGAITYIAPCDASVSPTHNFVALTLEDVTAGGEVLDDQLDSPSAPEYQNPCPEGEPCVLDFECEENADVEVLFDLTVMRPARQGFFDIVVDFDDLFCSAKLDTCTSDHEPLELLFGLPTATATHAERGATAVLALACTAGPSSSPATHLYRSAIDITCPGSGPASPPTVIHLDPSAGPGNALTPAGVFGNGVWQYGVYEGRESLDCDGTPCDKTFWNVAIGIEGLPPGCSLTAKATAADHALVEGALATRASYPEIFYSAQLTDQGGVVCAQHGLDATPGSGVYTEYKDIGADSSYGFELSQPETGGVDTHAVTIPLPPDLGGNPGAPATGATIEKGPPGVFLEDAVGHGDTTDVWQGTKGGGRGYKVECDDGNEIQWQLTIPDTEGDLRTISGRCDGVPGELLTTPPSSTYTLTVTAPGSQPLTHYRINIQNDS